MVGSSSNIDVDDPGVPYLIPDSPAISSHPKSSSSTASSDTDYFLPAINATDLEALKGKAISAYARHNAQKPTPDAFMITSGLSCDIITPPCMGSYNLVYLINFSDGNRWIARVPACAINKWDEEEVRNFMTRIHTTTLIRSKTQIPIPVIYTWEATKENQVGMPYTLEASVPGRLLADRWNDKDWSTEGKRLHALRQIASLMSQLHCLEFHRIGTLTFDKYGLDPQVGKRVGRMLDYDKVFRGEGVWGDLSTSGPYPSVRSYLLSSLEDPNVRMPAAEYKWGYYELIHLAIDSIPLRLNRGASFMVCHPDLNYQNIFVDDEGIITGLIDWDLVHTGPRALGYARYPSWITRDWDPVKYGYYDDEESIRNREDSPAQLHRYRREYANAFASEGLPLDKYVSEDTMLSHIVEAVDNALDDEVSSPRVLMWLLDWSFDGDPPCTLNEYCDAYLEGDADKWTEKIKVAFENMWHEEADDPLQYQQRWQAFYDKFMRRDETQR